MKMRHDTYWEGGKPLKEDLIWKKLKKYGIHNEKELDDVIKNTIFNISCFVTKERRERNEDKVQWDFIDNFFKYNVCFDYYSRM